MAFPPDSPYASALDNWNRFTGVQPDVISGGDMPAPDVPVPDVPDPAASIDKSLRGPRLLLAGAVPDVPPREEPKAVTQMEYQTGTPAEKAAAIGEKAEPTDTDYYEASNTSALKKNVLGRMAIGLGVEGLGAFADPSVMSPAAIEGYKKNPEITHEAKNIAGERALKEAESTASGRERIAQAESGKTPKPMTPIASKDEPVTPSSLEEARMAALQASGSATGGEPIRMGTGKYAEYNDKPYLQEITQRANEGAAAERTLGLVKASGQAQESLIRAGAEADVQNIQRGSAEKQARIQHNVDRAEQRYMDAIANLEGTHIDSGRLMKNPLMALITLGGGVVGGLYGAMSGTHKNQFLENLDGVINRDIQDQKMELEGKKGKAANAQNMLSYFRAKLGDERAAENAAKQVRLDQMDRTVKQLAAQNGSQEALVNADKASNLIQQRNAELKLKAYQDHYGMEVAKDNAMYGRNLQSQQLYLQSRQVSAAERAAGAQAAGPPPKANELAQREEGLMVINGRPVRIHAKAGAVDKLREKQDALGALKEDLAELEALGKQNTLVPGSVGAAEFESVLNRAMLHGKGTYDNVGALDTGSIGVMMKQYGSASAFANALGRTAARLGSSIRANERAEQNLLKTYPWNYVRKVKTTTDQGPMIHYEDLEEGGIGTPGAQTDIRAGEVEESLPGRK